jgi:hypothetical protein
VSDTPAGTDFVQVAGGAYFSLALRDDGSIVSWGDDSHGQVSDTPAGTDFVQVAGGAYFSLALRDDGSIVSWGDDGDGQVSGTPAGSDFVAVSAHGCGYHGLALRENGSIAAWGTNWWGEGAAPAGSDFVTIAAGGEHNLAWRADGSILAWGDDSRGQVSGTPAGSDSLAISAGGWHNLAVRPLPSDGFGKLAPLDGAGPLPLDVSLSWEAAPGAASYEYCADTTNDDACSGWVDAGGATSAALSGLASPAIYFWQVRAVNKFGTTTADGGAWWSFTTGPPGAFGKVAPAEGTTGRSSAVLLSWQAAPGAASYRYCLDTSDDDACAGSWVGVGSATSVELSGLVGPATYFWQVRAANGSGLTEGDSGVWWSFSAGPPDSFGKAAPSEGATGQSGRPWLSWEAVSGADSYEYCLDTIDDDACGGSWVSTGTGSTVQVTGLAYQTSYFWQVRAVNAFGATTADGGSWWSFTTKPTPPILETSLRSQGPNDGWVLERSETSGWGGPWDASSPTARVGDDEADRQYRSILDFDTSELPDSAVVVGLTLRLKRAGAVGTNPFGTLGLLKVDIKFGVYGRWEGLSRRDFNSVGSRGRVGRVFRVRPDGWHRAMIRPVAYPFVNTTGHTQFRLRFGLDDDDDQVADYLSFYTGDAPVEADRPELIITYYIP